MHYCKKYRIFILAKEGYGSDKRAFPQNLLVHGLFNQLSDDPPDQRTYEG